VRFLFLIPDLDKSRRFRLRLRLKASRLRRLLPLLGKAGLRTHQVWGGTLNIMRHCSVARAQGADAVLATESGQDTYGPVWGVERLPFVAWKDRRPDDVCIVPDIYTSLIGDIRGYAVAYEQSPLFVQHDFDYKNERVILWTDSPHMLEICKQAYPGKDIPIVPNIVDSGIWPFIPQSQRRTGELVAFPRKGPEFISACEAAYKAAGGKHWTFNLVDGLTLAQLAERFRTPQIFLASADVEGCALPPQEAMAAGIVVVGRNARGANFYMIDGQTAVVADTPEKVAKALLDLEQPEPRERLAKGGHDYIQRYFKEQEPSRFWREMMADPRWHKA
jgi:hypothetical protein